MSLLRVAAALLAALVMLAPLVAAGDAGDASANETTGDEEEPERSEDAAWVEDCPPDRMCAMGSTEPAPPPDANRTPEERNGSCMDCPTSHSPGEDGERDGPRYVPEPHPTDDTVLETGCPPGMVCALDGRESSSYGARSAGESAPEPFAGLSVLAAGLLSMVGIVAGHRFRV